MSLKLRSDEPGAAESTALPRWPDESARPHRGFIVDSFFVRNFPTTTRFLRKSIIDSLAC